MPKQEKSVYINRELSWLEFNQRVLDEAANTTLPLLERLKFLAITASNLDEFTMVRIGGLKILVHQRKSRRDPAGLTPRQQLEAVGRRVGSMVEMQYGLYREIADALSANGLLVVNRPEALSPEQHKWLKREFAENIQPLLSPVGIEASTPFRLRGLMLHCAVLLAPAEARGNPRFAVIPLGSGLPRFVMVPDSEKTVFLPVERAVAWHVNNLFGGVPVLECVPFRVTRNADIELREDLSSDLLAGMQELLEDRSETSCIRLEVESSASPRMLAAMKRQLSLEQADVYAVDGPVELRAFDAVSAADGFENLRNEAWDPVASPDIELADSMFAQIAQNDIGLVLPYESFDPVVRFVSEAAADPDVLAIKQVLYRTADQSALVEALVDAAHAGKAVTVLVELRARFDEARNISQAKRLEMAGAHVVYGVRGFKTHAKICLVVRRERHGIVRYVHFGTGNYNEKTARLYGDVGLFTCRPDFGADASDVFNAITGYSQPQALRQLDMAPFTIRAKLLDCIAGETERAKNGECAKIVMKMNSLSDIGIIDALYAASKAGVSIQLNIRGICCLRPGVPGLSENIAVVSIVDRFLEHARLFSFRDGGRNTLYLSSADAMPRNLDRRVELLVPIVDRKVREKFTEVLESYFKDTLKACILKADGTYKRKVPKKKASPCRCQKMLWERACKAANMKEQAKPTMLQPYRKNQTAET